MAVELHEAHRQAVRVGIVLLVVGHALRAQLARPVLKRRAAFDVRADVEERRARRRVRIRGRSAGLNAELIAAAAIALGLAASATGSLARAAEAAAIELK